MPVAPALETAQVAMDNAQAARWLRRGKGRNNSGPPGGDTLPLPKE